MVNLVNQIPGVGVFAATRWGGVGFLAFETPGLPREVHHVHHGIATLFLAIP
jgi:hypothetical protein